ncbi:hypothetical protein KIL84_000715 [Mauremys mutica]|uniref:Secreted protein n=1 Tax=Mauremys mutica TaxID=74926 RepID=A0A9D3WZC6_9SAUR|nr:hypothetical protein KIL84_000715 [Mauremys mutica]
MIISAILRASIRLFLLSSQSRAATQLQLVAHIAAVASELRLARQLLPFLAVRQCLQKHGRSPQDFALQHIIPSVDLELEAGAKCTNFNLSGETSLITHWFPSGAYGV